MPYSSEKQRRFMWSQHPEIAKRWEKEGKGYVKKKKTGNYSADVVKMALSKLK